MTFDFGWGLIGLAASAFLSATWLPGNSELSLTLFVRHWPENTWLAVGVATAANTSGSLVGMLIGRLLPAKASLPVWAKKHMAHLGPAVLLLSWLPVLGDALPTAAGWLRLAWLPCFIALLIGKAMRYLFVAYILLIMMD